MACAVLGKQMSLAIRPATSADMSAVDALLARAYPRLLAADYPPSVLVTALPIISRARPELLAGGRYFLAVAEDGSVLGAGGYSLHTPADPHRAGPGRSPGGVGHVRHVVTDDRHIRRGIGRAILNRILVEALRERVTLLECLATRTAVPFYLAMGFQTLGPVEVSLRPGIIFPVVRMQKALG